MLFEFFNFESVSSQITYRKYTIYIHFFLLSYLNSNTFSSLHDEHFETDEKDSYRTDESITL